VALRRRSTLRVTHTTRVATKTAWMVDGRTLRLCTSGLLENMPLQFDNSPYFYASLKQPASNEKVGVGWTANPRLTRYRPSNMCKCGGRGGLKHAPTSTCSVPGGPANSSNAVKVSNGPALSY
jgi:hypothetical protein